MLFVVTIVFQNRLCENGKMFVNIALEKILKRRF
jgi:hypothetical protein